MIKEVIEANCPAGAVLFRAVMESGMLQDAARLKVTREGEVVLVEFTHRKILDEANIAEIGDQLVALVENEHRPKVIISFAGVDHLSSAALGTLITVNNKVRNHDGQLRLCNIHPQIFEVFVITKLNKLFRIYPTIKEAKESLESQSKQGVT